MAQHDDDRRWQNAQDDRRWEAARAAERSSRLYDALRRGDHDTARWIIGAPPAGTDDPDDRSDRDGPERTAPPTAGEQFREHTQALLFNLDAVYDFLLPLELRQDWASRVERLDLAQPDAGLAAIEVIREEFQWAVNRFEPPNSDVSRRIEWDYFVPRIGHEIDWVERLFRHVLSFG